MALFNGEGIWPAVIFCLESYTINCAAVRQWQVSDYSKEKSAEQWKS